MHHARKHFSVADERAHLLRKMGEVWVLPNIAAVSGGAGSAGQRRQQAAQLVHDRERRLKTSQSRFANRAVRDRWTGASGTERLSFRWAQAKAHLRDLANAQ